MGFKFNPLTGNLETVAAASAGAGTGDFLADGSVPMTGDLNINNHQIKNVALVESGDPLADSLEISPNSLTIRHKNGTEKTISFQYSMAPSDGDLLNTHATIISGVTENSTSPDILLAGSNIHLSSEAGKTLFEVFDPIGYTTTQYASIEQIGSDLLINNVAGNLILGGLAIDFNGVRAVDAADPVDPTDLATKQYVDSHAGGLPSNLTIANSGSDAYVHSTTGRILLGTNTSTVQVDANGFNAGNHTITNVGVPANSGDAANKSYVDSYVTSGYIAGEDIAANDICVLANNGSNVLKVFKATAAAASNASLDSGKWLAAGVAVSAALTGNLVTIQKIGSQSNAATFTTTPGASDIGKSIYLSTTAGQFTFTKPASSGDVIVCLGRHKQGGFIDLMQAMYMGVVP